MLKNIFNTLISCLIMFLVVAFLMIPSTETATATQRRIVQPQNGAPILSGLINGEQWLKTIPDSRIAYCNEAFVAFRASPSQSYIISSNVQSLTAAGLCDRIDQYFSIEENLESRLATAAAIAPLLFADTPIGTKYNQTEPLD